MQPIFQNKNIISFSLFIKNIQCHGYNYIIMKTKPSYNLQYYVVYGLYGVCSIYNCLINIAEERNFGISKCCSIEHHNFNM